MKSPSAKKHKSISLVVLNFNGRQHLDEYFTSVFSQTMQPDEVIMFDNMGTDGSCEFVQEKFPSVKIITEDRFNTGTALAYNTAIQHASGEFIVLQSNDIVLDTKCVEVLYKNLEADSKIGIVSSITIRYPNKKLRKYIVDQAGGLMDTYGFGMQNYPQIPVKDIPDIGEVFFAYGDSIIFRRDVFNKINGLDERMFMIHDDIDLSWRMRLQGYKIIYAKHSFVYHKGSATIGSNLGRPHIRFLSERNGIRCFIKNTSPQQFIRTLPLYIMLLCGEMGYFLYRGKFQLFFADVCAILWNLWYLPETLRLRAYIQSNIKRNNVDTLFYNKSFKLMLFKHFSRSL